MPKTDKAAEIAAAVWWKDDISCDGYERKLARRIRAAMKAERTRCVNYLKRIKQTSHEGEERFVHSFIDDLIEVIDPPKPKKKARGKRV